MEVDDDGVLWAHYPFRNRQSCAKKFVDVHHPLGGKKWDTYRVCSLYFPEVHTTKYEVAEKFCMEIEERPMTDNETRVTLLQNALLAFRVRHAVPEQIPSEVKICLCMLLILIILITTLCRSVRRPGQAADGFK